MNLDSANADIESKKQKLSELQDTKGRLSRLIGVAKSEGHAPDDLIRQLKVVSSEAKTLQKAIKSQLNADSEAAHSPSDESVIAPAAVRDSGPCVGPVSVETLDTEAQEESWNAYVQGHPAATVAHTLALREAIAETYGHAMKYLCAWSGDGRVIGVLPLVQLKSWLFGNYIVSIPYFNYGGVLADNAEAADALLHAAGEWQREIGSDHIELRHASDLAKGLPQRTDKVSFWLPLPANEQALWTSFSSKLRAQIRRAEKETPEIVIGKAELLREFYAVFSRNMRDLGTPVYGMDFFRNLLDSFPDTANIVVARINGVAVGASFLMAFGNRMEIPWASTVRAYNHTGINMLMYWSVLKFAISQRYEFFDFGRCTEHSGTYRFKQQWGAKPIPLYWDYCLGEGGEMPGLNPDNPKFKLLIAAWKKLPLFVSNLLGPAIVRSLP